MNEEKGINRISQLIRFRRWKINDIIENIKKEKGCKQCGQKHPGALQFHHRNPEEKEAEISSLISKSVSIEYILEEIEKCDILCANCHSILHWELKRDSRKSHDLNLYLAYIQKNYEPAICKKCGVSNETDSFRQHRRICQKCYNEHQKIIMRERRYNAKFKNNSKPKNICRPSKEILLKEVEELGYSATGRKYGVSDNAIRKWLYY